ncbi:YbaY family lipoprotein [Mesorhizobium sp. WSM3859]|uniref:YbaY family lipoprotein n=1 Tax=Mesorhizobium sp. WSM3859 TaxID=2029402 RepID=UPI000BB00AF7|nr:YbaY family lipoprotein [Mesorhizobium sp. WSM3859]PBC08173.1 hypothetical protein CK230_21920 [Mesorhizobium sp. WSM3859]
MSPPAIVGTIDLTGAPAREAVDVRVRLEDTTMMDGPSEVIAETLVRLEPDAPMPAPFRLLLPDERLDPRRQYTLTARGRRAPGTEFRDCGTVEAFPWKVGTKTRYRLAMKWFDRN